jgi:erythromycin esterase-like protein
MWANQEIVELAEWLRAHNAALPPGERVGIYGIDLYEPWKSMDEVVRFLEAESDELGESARRHYREWARYRGDGHAYARAVFGFLPSAEEGARAVVESLRQFRPEADSPDLDRWFYAKQSAKVVQNAEQHFRTMAEEGPGSWNARARHMHTTVRRLLDHYGPNSHGIVWAHNTHVGDARATAMRQWGQVNIGQLAREEMGSGEVFSIGLGMARGEVVASRQWGSDPEVMTLPAPAPGSFEELFSGPGRGDFWLLLDSVVDAGEWLEPRGHRAIGVTYQPERERQGNFVATVLGQRYDALLFWQETRPLRPLH